MKHLSNDSRAFLRKQRYLSPSERSNGSFKLHYAYLFCELYELISHSADTLNGLSMGSWSVCYQGENVDTHGFLFKLTQSMQEQYPHILICIRPFGESYIEVLSSPGGTRVGKSSGDEVKAFIKTPAYKRYFEPNNPGPYDIKAVIPSSQIVSREFGTYIVHLFNMMQPYLQIIAGNYQKSRKAA